MSTRWIAAFAALTAVVGLLAILLLGLMRRVLDVLQRLEAALTPGHPDDHSAGRPRVGDLAPPLPAPATGQSAGAGTLVVFLEAGCDPCQVLAADLSRRRFEPAPYRGIIVADDVDAFDRGFPDHWTVVADPDYRIFGSWQVTGNPIAFLIDATGTLRARDYANRAKDLQTLLQRASSAPAQPGPQTVPQPATNSELEMSSHDH